MPSYLITGCSRGLGLAMCKELLQDPNNIVIATARNPEASTGLKDLMGEYSPDRLVVLMLDVMKSKNCAAVAENVKYILPKGLDHVISNAAVGFQMMTTFEELDMKLFEEEILFHTVSHLNVFRAFLPLLKNGANKKIMVMTSLVGSIETSAQIPNLANAYAVGKAATNMLVHKWSITLKNDGITAFVIHPGWVKVTGLGATIEDFMYTYLPDIKSTTQQESVEGCLKVLKDITVDEAGSFYNYDGTKIPW